MSPVEQVGGDHNNSKSKSGYQCSEKEARSANNDDREKCLDAVVSSACSSSVEDWGNDDAPDWDKLRDDDLFDNYTNRNRSISENSVGSLRLKSGTLIDPFPSPTPTPRSSCSLPAPPFFDDDHDERIVPSLDSSGHGQNHNRQTGPSSSSRQGRQRPSLSLHPCQEGLVAPLDTLDTNTSHITPPFTPHAPYLPTQTPLSTSSHQSPVRTYAQSPTFRYNNKSWKDPFPTPDISVNNDRYSKFRDDDSRDDHCDENHYPFDPLKMQSLPTLPSKEELNDSSAAKNNYTENGKVGSVGFQTLRRKIHSTGQVHTLDTDDLKVRRTSSDSSLMLPLERVGSISSGFPLIKRPSMEEFWRAFQSGPDGNDLEEEYMNRSQKLAPATIIRREDIFNKTRDNDDFDSLESSHRGQKQKWGRSLTMDDANHEYRNNASTASIRKTSSIDYDGEWEGIRQRPLKRGSDSILSGALAPDIRRCSAGESEKLTMTPNRKSIQSWKSFRSPTVGRVRNSAEELVFSPVRNLIVTNSERAAKIVHTNSERAAKLVRNTQRRLEERNKLRRQRRLARMKEPPPSWWIVIPADHPYKITWDVLTMLWAMLGAYRTHTRIRDRVFDQSPLILLTEIWFTVDILLNFVTEHKTSKGDVIRDGKSVWARYLTTWFVIDLLSLIPWERIYLRPVVEKIKKRNIFQKTFFRSKAVVRVSRVLRGRHVKLFGRVSKQTGTPLRRLVNLAIKYIPKYLLFYRNMRGALAVRTMRLIHWFYNLYKGFWVKAKKRFHLDNSDEDDDDDDEHEDLDHEDSDDEYSDHEDGDHEDGDGVNEGEGDQASLSDNYDNHSDRSLPPTFRRGVSDSAI